MGDTSVTPLRTGRDVKEQIRWIVQDNAGLRVLPEQIQDSTDLYRAGMTSYSSVQLMISLENELGLEFPDAMLNRDVFESIDSIAAAVTSLLSAKP